MTKQLNYTMIDMRSFSHAFQFEHKNENIIMFLDFLINEIPNDDVVVFFFTKNDDLFRKEQYKKINFDYNIPQFDENDIIKNRIEKYIENQSDNNLDWRVVNFNGYESKDIIFSSIMSMKSYVMNCNAEQAKFNKNDRLLLKIDLLTTSKNMVLSKLLFNNNDYFEFNFKRYVKSKSFNGFEEILDLNKYLEVTYGDLKINNHLKLLENKNKLEKFIYYQNIINNINIMCGLKNTVEPIKILNNFGIKKAVKLINNFFSLKHFYEVYDIDNVEQFDKSLIQFKKEISKENLNKMIYLSEVNNINYTIDKDFIFKEMLNKKRK